MTELERSSEDRQLYVRYSEDLGLYIGLVLKEGEVESVIMAGAEPEEPHGTDHPYLMRVIGHLSSGGDDLRDIPVRIRSDGFDREVLEALRDIPPGEVMTYGEVARRLGRPGAARAVGNACARNPVPIIVPCHRVVPASGGLGNYSGGEGQGTKAAILRKEREHAAAESSRKGAGRASRSERPIK